MYIDLNEEELSKLTMEGREHFCIKTYKTVAFIKDTDKITKDGGLYLVQCSECAKDSYLFGLGLFAAPLQNIKRSIICGCSKCFKIPEELLIKKLKRIIENNGFKFIGFNGEYKGVKGKCITLCPRHGISDNASPQYIINKNGPACRVCGDETISLLNKIPEEKMIAKFLPKYPVGTRLNKIDKKDNFGRSIYWLIYCPDCDLTVQTSTQSLRLGSRGCDCGRRRQTQAYVNLIYEGDNPIALKFGVSINAAHRVKQQISGSIYSVRQSVVYEFPDKLLCLEAEKAVKHSVSSKYLPRETFRDGYTETTSLSHYIDIIKIYKEYGGFLIDSDKNTKAFKDTCVAFVEYVIFGVDLLNDGHSDYFSTTWCA